MSNQKIISKLKELSFFVEVSEPHLEEIASIVQERVFNPGEIIIKENSSADAFFIIYEGLIEIFKKFEDEDEIVLGVHSNGEFFGEMAILDEGPRSASARALKKTTIMIISQEGFEKVVSSAPRIAYFIMKELSTRLRQTGALLVWELKRKQKELDEAYIETVKMVVRIIENDPSYMQGHSERVASISKALGKAMGMTTDELKSLELSALLHDVGMASVNEDLLKEPRFLKLDEREEIKKHAVEGKRMLESISILKNSLSDVLHHHERFDGGGYPERLAGDSIPLTSRILTLVDVFDALTHDRPQRTGLPEKEAIDFLQEHSGTFFDPEVVRTFLELIKTKKI